MDSDVIKLAAAAFGLGMVLAYAWWTKIRVMRLRDNLFTIRDRMFDEALAIGQVDDPAHREYRELLNGLIRIAGTIGPMTFAYVAASKVPATQLKKALTPEMDAIVGKARERILVRLVKYLSRETLTGLFLSMLLSVIPRPVVEDKEKAGVSNALKPMPRLINIPMSLL